MIFREKTGVLLIADRRYSIPAHKWNNRRTTVQASNEMELDLRDQASMREMELRSARIYGIRSTRLNI